MAIAGCQTSDQEIRADIAGKAQQDLNLAGLEYTVANGTVNFTGRCPSSQAFAKVKQTIENIHVIKAVHYNVHIGPLTLDSLTRVKLQADSVLAKYPKVVATVNTSGINLRGPVTATERDKLVHELQMYRHGRIIDSLTID